MFFYQSIIVQYFLPLFFKLSSPETKFSTATLHRKLILEATLVQLKGKGFDELEADSMLTRLKIDFKKHAKAGTLSGGQKRKLSLAIALIGGSEVCVETCCNTHQELLEFFLYCVAFMCS